MPFRCAACGLVYFFNPTVAAAAFIFDAKGRALFIRRSHEPAKGKLGVPGGFIDIGESAEQALRREVREEVGLEIENMTFLTSYPNFYEYGGVTYPVCDFMFKATAANPKSARALDAVDAIEWLPLTGVDFEDLAFPSIREGLRWMMMV